MELISYRLLVIRCSLARYSQRLLFTAFCLLSAAYCFPQQYNFKNYSVKDGVAQSQVYCLLQDSRGYLWMGTRGGGLTRYDGVKFETFTVKNELVNNYVACIKEDAKHNLWIGTINGFCQYNGVRFTTYKPDKKGLDFAVNEIDFDSKGRKWLATNQGVVMFDEKSKAPYTYIFRKAKIRSSVVNAILVDRDDNVWYGDGEGLYKINVNGNVYDVMKYGRSKGFMNNSINTLKKDEKGDLWIGTYGDGVYVYNGRQFSRIDPELELYKKTVLDFYFDKHDNIWMATLNDGVAQYNKISKTFSWLTDKEGLSNNHVRSIIQDRSGNFWFGTSGGGVCNYFGKQFTNYDKTTPGINGNFIYSIFRDSKQRLWFGTSEKGVSVLDSSKFSNYSSANGFQDLKVKAINEDNYGNIYFGTDGQGVYVFNNNEFKFLEELGKKYIRAIVKDKDGNLWFATAGKGLFKLVLNGDKVFMLNFTTKDGLLHDRLTCLHYDKKGRIWYGTEANGIGCIEEDKVSMQTLTEKNGLVSNAIRCLNEDSKGFLWIGTVGEGITCLPLYQEKFLVENYDHTNGLTSSNIYLLCFDSNDNLFVGTETGLDHMILDKERKPVEIKHYSKGEGFVGIETCQNSYFNDADGTIWFGTINCVSKYNPANQVKNDAEPVTNITNVKIGNEDIGATEFKNCVGDWNMVSNIVLPHDQNTIRFEFTGINFSNPEAVRYQWKLEGADKDWSPVQTDKSVNYSGLSPRDYVFMVKSCNEDGVWNKVPTMIRFSILPPFWLRWWFIAAVALGLTIAIMAVFKWRVNRVKKKAAEAQQKIQMEKDLMELEQKALRLQMNPHFIFNALNSIQSQIGTDNEQTARYYLAKFSRLMRQILDNSRNSEISLEEEINTLENYLLIEKFCNGDRFDYKIMAGDQLEKDYIKIPPMLLQPFIENSIKHGLKYVEGKRGSIEVNFEEKDNMLECSVTDNGIGRTKAGEMIRSSKETYHKSTALIVTQERLDLLKGNEKVKSLEIIDLYDAAGTASGTKVIVRVPLN
jgi:ligand-binding sensor domain-containing protein/two-component sensor histidine kinase